MAKKQFKNLKSPLIISLLAIALSGCVTKNKKGFSGVMTPTSTPKTSTTISPPEAEEKSESVETPATVEASPQDEAETEKKSTEAATKVIPKFGVILSGGGAKAWAHIGVLKEMQRLKWPITSIAGFEWGAPMAALYAQNLSANEVEWEMSKLKEFDKWDQFVKAAFAKRSTGDMKIPFVCPSLNIAKQSAFFLNRGQLTQLIPFCIGSPTLTKPISQSVAVMTDVSGLAQHLRATGASKIIVINVLSQSTKRSFVRDYESSENIWWTESAALIAKKPVGVDEVIDINLDDVNIKDLDKRREITAKGVDLSSAQLRKLAEKYGL
jgi:NTE family protein